MATWTSEEDKILRELYETAPREDLLLKFPGRDWKSLYKRSVRLGLSRPKDDAWKTEDDDRLKLLYPRTPRDEIVALFPGRTWKAISWHAVNVLRLFRDEDMALEESKKTNLAKRGVEFPTQSEAVREKVKQAVQEKYGVDNVFQAEEVKKTIVETNIERYGVENPQQNEQVKSRAEATNMKRYGVSNPFQLLGRVQGGMVEKYGEAVPLRVPELMGKKIATNMERYGAPTPAQNEKVQEKTESTNMERYGFNTPLKHPAVKYKIRQAFIEKYGVDNPAKIPEVQQKIIKTNLERYGVEYSLQSPAVREKGYETSKLNGSFSSSDEEEAFTAYLKTFDSNTEPHVKHPIGHVIDYYMPKYDLWVQYDGAYWHGKVKRVNVSERSQKIETTIKNDQYENDHIPNLIRFWSDDVATAIKDGTIFDVIEGKIIEKSDIPVDRVCHQFEKKQQWLRNDLKELPFDPSTLSNKELTLSNELFSTEIKEFIEKYEWLGNVGVYPKWCFTARYRGHLCGVILINDPTSYSSLLGEKTSTYEALIQRGATASWAPKNLGSHLIMFSCKWMARNTEKRAFIGYADPRANELGTIYQACGFDYLGNKFGNSWLYRHPAIKNGAVFSSQLLKRTSSFRKWCKENGVCMEENWFKANHFKNLKVIPTEIRRRWYQWIKEIIMDSEKIPVEKKHKYVLVMGKNKREKRFLTELKTYTPVKYPQR